MPSITNNITCWEKTMELRVVKYTKVTYAYSNQLMKKEFKEKLQQKLVDPLTGEFKWEDVEIIEEGK